MAEENLVHFYVHVVDDGIWAQCRELPNCMTESYRSLDSLWASIQEVFELHLRGLWDAPNYEELKGADICLIFDNSEIRKK